MKRAVMGVILAGLVVLAGRTLANTILKHANQYGLVKPNTSVELHNYYKHITACALLLITGKIR